MEAIINDAIRAAEVRLVGVAGEQIGVVATKDALKRAEEAGLDLVLVAGEATPPVAKILDYSKYKYELEIKKREARRNTGSAELKEVRFRLKIDKNDFAIKVAQAAKFLKSGDKLKVQIQFRGREQQHPEFGVDLLLKVATELEEFGSVINRPTHEGRTVSMMMQPVAKKEQTVSEQRRRGDEVRNARAERLAKRLAAKGMDIHGNKLQETKKEKRK